LMRTRCPASTTTTT